MSTQLSFDIRLRDSAAFENFFPGANREAVSHLAAVASDNGPRWSSRTPVTYLWGGHGTGKTHLLQAACRAAQQAGQTALYIPLDCAAKLSPRVLEDVGAADLVCIDDLQCIAGLADWETALFNVCEHCRASVAALLVTASARPADAGLRMPDLATRLGWGLVYPLHALNDDEKVAAVRLRARNRGFELSDAVARYVLNRYPRDMHALFSLLERMDQTSLAMQRQITIPFIRSLEAED